MPDSSAVWSHPETCSVPMRCEYRHGVQRAAHVPLDMSLYTTRRRSRGNGASSETRIFFGSQRTLHLTTLSRPAGAAWARYQKWPSDGVGSSRLRVAGPAGL